MRLCHLADVSDSRANSYILLSGLHVFNWIGARIAELRSKCLQNAPKNYIYRIKFPKIYKKVDLNGTCYRGRLH